MMPGRSSERPANIVEPGHGSIEVTLRLAVPTLCTWNVWVANVPARTLDPKARFVTDVETTGVPVGAGVAPPERLTCIVGFCGSFVARLRQVVLVTADVGW